MACISKRSVCFPDGIVKHLYIVGALDEEIVGAIVRPEPVVSFMFGRP